MSKINRVGPLVAPCNAYQWAGSIEFCSDDMKHPVVRALDYHPEDSASDALCRNLESSFERLKTRKERYGDIGARLRTGMMRKPPHVIDVRDPLNIQADKLTGDAKENWRLMFSNETNAWGRKNQPTVFLIIDAPDVVTYSHKPGRFRTEIPGTASKEHNRRISAVCVHEKLLDVATVSQLESIAQRYQCPFFRIDTLLGVL